MQKERGGETAGCQQGSPVRNQEMFRCRHFCYRQSVTALTRGNSALTVCGITTRGLTCFPKSSPVFRKKKKIGGAQTSGAQSSAGVAGKSTSKKATLLSFDDEDEEEEGGAVSLEQLKKTKKKLGKALAANLAAVAAETQDAQEQPQQPQRAGQYTAEHLAELRQSTLATSARPRHAEEEEEAAALAGADDASGMQVERLDEQGMELDTEEAEAILRAAQDGNGSGRPEYEQGEEAGEGGAIPSADAIAKAKARRQNAREQQQEDFIPLTAGAKLRAVHAGRRQDDDGSDTEELSSEKMSFGEAARRDNRQAARLQAKAALRRGGDKPSKDKTVQEWEQQQMAAGARGARPEVVQASLQQAVATAMGKRGIKVATRVGALPRGPVGTVPTDTSEKEPMTLEALQRKLQDTLADMLEVHSNHTRHLERVQADGDAAQAALPGLEQQLAQATQRYTFYQESKGFVRDLLACLDDKVPLIDSLCARMHRVRADHSAALLQARRRRTHALLRALATAPLPDAANPDAIPFEPEDREAFEGYDRVWQRSATASSLFPESDDECNESSALSVSNSMATIQSEAAAVFDDVIEEYSEIPKIAAHFEEWKEKYPTVYRDAFVGLSLQKILQPLVNLQLLSWEPLDTHSVLEAMPWFTDLVNFGAKENAAEESEESHLVPDLVESTVVPFLTVFAKEVWDPFLKKQNNAFFNLVCDLANIYPTINGSSDNTQALIAAVSARLKSCAEEDIVLPPCTNPENERVVSVLVRRCSRFVAAAVQWGVFLPDTSVQDVVICSVLQRVLQPFLLHSVLSTNLLAACRDIIHAVPHRWFAGSGIAAVISRKGLSFIVRTLTDVARKIRQEDTDVATRMTILQNIFSHLGEEDLAKLAVA
eukprot:m.251467 g.251467  ORF g.251467 m.251467 type:complete len:883 (-) comp22650_c16_seq7:60-2708(-)